MEKINVAELLRNCPRGMELDCTMFDDVKFIAVDEAEKPICIRTGVAYRFLTKFGTWTFDENAKCVIFPKGKTTWEGFIPPCKFKDGDIIYIHSASPWICIYKEGGEKENVYYKYVAMTTSSLVYDCYPLCHRNSVKEIRHATEEEKQKLLQAIKDRGYKWNTETKTLEKLVEPNFKVGDTITNGKTSITIGYIDDEYYYEISRNIANRLFIKNQDEWNLVPNKFDINTLVPFETRVLVRNEYNNIWKPAIFGYYAKDKNAPYYIVGGTCWSQCIPYECNKHLLGKTDDCDEFYKIS